MDQPICPLRSVRRSLLVVLDRGALLKDRREAAWILAKGGDAETLSALKQILADPAAAPDLKAAIIEGLAFSNDPRKKEVFLSALAEKNEIVARAAIKGLSSAGDQENVDIPLRHRRGLRMNRESWYQKL